MWVQSSKSNANFDKLGIGVGSGSPEVQESSISRLWRVSNPFQAFQGACDSDHRLRRVVIAAGREANFVPGEQSQVSFSVIHCKESAEHPALLSRRVSKDPLSAAETRSRPIVMKSTERCTV